METERSGRARRAAAGGAALSLTCILAACGGSSAKAIPRIPVRQLLTKARATIDRSQAFHFKITGSHVSSSGMQLLGGSGVIVRPDQMQAQLMAQAQGLDVAVNVVGIGSKFWVQAPFTTGYALTNPATYGMGHPMQLLSTTNGISSLLTSMRNPVYGQDKVMGGVRVRTVSGSVPGTSIPVIPDQAPSKPVGITAMINPANDQVVELVLSGPFTTAKYNTTYTVALSKYGQATKISPPTS